MRLRYLAQPARLRDGRAAWTREVRPDDEAAMRQFIANLSPASRYFRFMMGMRELSAEALWQFTRPQPGKEAVLVSTPGSSLGVITGVAQFVIDAGGEHCEFALAVDDGWQRQGLGSILLSELGTLAARHGVHYIHADVLADNHPMRRLAEKTGCELRHDATAPFVLRLARRIHGEAFADDRPPTHGNQAASAGIAR